MCFLEVDSSWCNRQNESEINVNDMSSIINKDVPIVSIFDLQDKAHKGISG